MVDPDDYGWIRVTIHTGMDELWSFQGFKIVNVKTVTYMGKLRWFVMLVLILHLMEVLTITFTYSPLETEKGHWEAIVFRIYHLYLTLIFQIVEKTTSS